MRINKLILFLILTIAFVVRVLPINFPSFTQEEARIAFRGYSLAATGKDELGRVFPILFNSLDDYKLPAVSYLTAGGEFMFGKTEFGARISFIVLGSALVLLVYQVAKSFSQNKFFWFSAAFMVAFSPVLIFLSKVPNEAIVLTFFFVLLFYLLINNKNLFLIFFIMIISVLTSKQSWFILPPFTFFTIIFYQNSVDQKRKLTLIGFSILLVISAFMLFLTVPQSKRSLLENNFSIFSDVTIKNGIDKLRGQGIESGWPQIIDRALFNKIQFSIVGILHWLSNLTPAIYFGQFDGKGEMNYSYLGAWSKILIIPFGLGVAVLIKKGDLKKKLLLFYFLLLTFPAIFVYPNLSLALVVLTIPFMTLAIAFGFQQLNKKIFFLIFSLMILELIVNIYNLTPEYKNTNSLRPIWIEAIVENISQKSRNYQTAVSDDIAPDIVSYIEWYSPVNPQTGFQSLASPYKFRQYKLANIKILGSDESFTTCGKDGHMKVFVSKRDLNKIRRQFEIKIVKSFKDNIQEDKAFLIEGVCIK